MKGAFRTVGSVSIAAMALAACSSNPRPATLDMGTDGLVWPAPPEQTRISYVGQIASDQDLGKKSGFFDRLKNGILGTGEDALLAKRPFDTHVDEFGRVYVTNGALSAILVMDRDQRDAQVLAPEGAGALARPLGLDGDGAGTIFVADPARRHVIALDYEGQFVQAYGGTETLLNPVDVAVSRDGRRLYVVDSYLHQVVMFDRSGEVLGRIGRDEGSMEREIATAPEELLSGHGHGNEAPSDVAENRGLLPGEFRYPSFIDVGPDGTVYVSDAVNYRVQAFDANGEFLRVFGFHGDTPGALARPKGVATDSEGHVYIVDAAFNNVQIFDSDANLLLAFAGVGTGPGTLWLPLGLSIDEQDRIYVADRFNDRVQIFQYHPAIEGVVTDETPEPGDAPPPAAGDRGEG